MKKIKNLKLPISSYSVQPSFDDDRYLKLRVKVMHTGLNLNNTVFGLDAIERAKPTIANIPLLAFVKSVDGEEKKDFGGHDFEIRVTEGEMKYVYLGRPIGIIPETNNYEVVSEDGSTFVVVDGYVWRDYANEALDIFERDSSKSVSMEINVLDYEPMDSAYEITNYAYTGIAVLGEDVNPAMVGAKADIVKYSKDSIAEMMTQLKTDLEAYTEEENSQPVEENSEQVEDESSEPAEENTDNSEPAEENTDDSEPAEDNSEQEDEEESQPAEDSSEQTEEEEESEPAEENSEQVDDEDSQPEENNSTPDSKSEEFKALEDKYNTLLEEVKELRKFKESTEKAEKQSKIDELLAQFSDLEGDEAFGKIKTNALDFSLEELETKLYAIRGRQISNQNSPLVYNFSRVGKSQTKEPSWADLVRARTK